MQKPENKTKKAKKKKEYRAPSKRQPCWACVRWIFKLIYGCKVINPCGELPSKAILISNHSAKQGPISLEVSLPVFNVKWGAHEMLEGYKQRYLYLRNVLYIQKLKKGKFYATVKSLFEAFFSKFLYRGMKFLPTYPDLRFASTVKMTNTVLDSDASVLIFPEDSREGYFDELTSAFPGFVKAAEFYSSRHEGEDLPIIPLYYHKGSRQIFVGERFYVGKMKQEGMTREQIADYGKDKINELYRTCVLGREK